VVDFVQFRDNQIKLCIWRKYKHKLVKLQSSLVKFRLEILSHWKLFIGKYHARLTKRLTYNLREKDHTRQLIFHKFKQAPYSSLVHILFHNIHTVVVGVSVVLIFCSCKHGRLSH